VSTDAFDGFVAHWLDRAPRLALAAGFAGDPAARRAFLAPRVLLGELIEASVAVGDERVADAKLGWWFEEAEAWAAGTSRHPLATAISLSTASKPLRALLGALRAWLEGPPPADTGTAWRTMAAVAGPATMLAGEPSGAQQAWQLQAYACALQHSLEARVPLGTVLPMDVLARSELRRSQLAGLPVERRSQLLRDALAGVPWQTVAIPPGKATAALWALDTRHLARQARGQLDARPGLGDAWAAWRAARQARSQR
jgi:hypothetical protein